VETYLKNRYQLLSIPYFRDWKPGRLRTMTL